jgi:hypothetical protein
MAAAASSFRFFLDRFLSTRALPLLGREALLRPGSCSSQLDDTWEGHDRKGQSKAISAVQEEGSTR